MHLYILLAGHDTPPGMDLQGEVMACAYEDVQVMWSILDKSKPRLCNVTSWWMDAVCVDFKF